MDLGKLHMDPDKLYMDPDKLHMDLEKLHKDPGKLDMDPDKLHMDRYKLWNTNNMFAKLTTKRSKSTYLHRPLNVLSTRTSLFL
jgi:hypothetical protein